MELHYFAVRGRAEPLRLILADSGLAWRNVLLTSERWAEEKPAALLGTCPILYYFGARGREGGGAGGGGVQVAQCVGIAHFLAHKLQHRGLLGEPGNDAHLALALGLSTCGYQELLSPLLALQWAPVRSRGIPLAQVVHAYYAKVLLLVPLLLRALGAGPYFCGATPCVADYFIAEWVENHQAFFATAARNTDDVPAPLVALARRVAERPAVAAYIADREGGRAALETHAHGPLRGRALHARSPGLGEVVPFLAAYVHDRSNADANAGRAAF